MGREAGLAGIGCHHPDPAKMRAAVMARIAKRGQKPIKTAGYRIEEGRAVLITPVDAVQKPDGEKVVSQV